MNKEIGATAGVGNEATDVVAPLEVVLEGATGGEAPAPCGTRVAGGERRDVSRDTHTHGGSVHQVAFLRICADDQWELRRQGSEGGCRVGRVHRPCHDEAIGGHIAVERGAGVVAVHRLDVFIHASAEAIQVEVRIPCDERIEGPEDCLDTDRAAVLPLVGLELLTDTVPTGLGMHGEHVGPVREPAVSHTGDPEDEAEELAFVVKGTGGNAPHFLGHLEQHRGGFLVEIRTPGELLKGNALTAFSKAFEGTNLHVRWGRRGEPVEEPPAGSVVYGLCLAFAHRS